MVQADVPYTIKFLSSLQTVISLARTRTESRVKGAERAARVLHPFPAME